jgi:hypothetical protein
MSDEERVSYVNSCKSLHERGDRSISAFFTKYYGLSEGNVTRSDSSGWVCAQRRLGRAFGWLHTMYHSERERDSIPDYLFLVDDDTFIDTADVISYLQGEADGNKGLLMRAGCVFEKNDDSIPYSIPYGGFGLFLNKAALTKLSKPIYCRGDQQDEAVCEQINADRIGEASIFRDGMSIFELFYRFSATKYFCMHSDWLSGYVVEFYLTSDKAVVPEGDHTLGGILEYPMCGNRTAFSGSIRHCTQDSYTCHNQSPQDMEHFALASYYRAPASYVNAPILAGTDLSSALSSIKDIVASKQSHLLPNLLLIESSTTGLMDWLLANGACNPRTFDDEPYYFMREAHFFDQDERFDQGLPFYSQRFNHCSEEEGNTIILDATPDYLLYPQRVFDTYSQTLTDLKLIFVLSDPVSREAALYNRKVQEYQSSLESNSWFSDVAHSNGTVMSFDDYAETVIKRHLTSAKSATHPGKYVNHLKHWASLFDRRQILILNQEEVETNSRTAQWRITEFLGLDGVHINLKMEEPSAQYTSTRASHVLQPLFSQSNYELYHFLETQEGPPMEQRPFTRFEHHKQFAFATVLGWSPPSSQNMLYLNAIRVLIRSLKTQRADTVVLMTYHDPEVESLLMADGAIVKLINRIEHSQDVAEFEDWFVDIALAKLRVFELTDYDRVQYLDADVVIDAKSSLDELFFSFPDSELVSEGLGTDSPLRAGWMMIKPSQSNFDAMEAILTEGSFDQVHGWNGLDLPVVYPNWNTNSGWNFYGSSLEQGLLFHFFYALPRSMSPTSTNSQLLHLISDEELHQLGVYHFYGDRKPWSRSRLSDRAMISAQKHWLASYGSLDANGGQGGFQDYILPLTEKGAEQYSKARVLYGYISPTAAPTSIQSTPPSCICDGSTKAFAEPL